MRVYEWEPYFKHPYLATIPIFAIRNKIYILRVIHRILYVCFETISVRFLDAQLLTKQELIFSYFRFSLFQFYNLDWTMKRIYPMELYIFSPMELYFLPYGVILSPLWSYTFSPMELYFLPNGVILSPQWSYTFSPMECYFLNKIDTIVEATKKDN